MCKGAFVAAQVLAIFPVFLWNLWLKKNNMIRRFIRFFVIVKLFNIHNLPFHFDIKINHTARSQAQQTMWLAAIH